MGTPPLTSVWTSRTVDAGGWKVVFSIEEDEEWLANVISEEDDRAQGAKGRLGGFN